MQIIKLKFLELSERTRFISDRSLELKALIVGGLAGLTGALFQIGVEGVLSKKDSFINYLSSYLFSDWFWAALITSSMVFISLFFVRRFSPEAAGSGIQEIEGFLDGVRPMRWKSVFPIKFFGGILALSSGMILGREGPSVQLGGACGALVNSIGKKADSKSGHALVAAGAAAGLAAAFNAPLAGLVFVIEEMRNPFQNNFLNVRLLGIATLTATLVVNLILGQGASLPIPIYKTPGWSEMPLYLIMGGIIGITGAALNKGIISGLDMMQFLNTKKWHLYLWIGLLGISIGILHFYFPDVVGGGYEIVNTSLSKSMAMQGLFIIILIRLILTILCFSSGVPGGVFAPMIVLGTLIGLWCGSVATYLFPELITSPYPFAVAGMGALFAATVQAPITGIILVVEMTANYSLIVPIMIACIGADIVAHELGTKPLYSVLLEKLLDKNKSI